MACNNLAYLLTEYNGDVTVALSLAPTGREGLPNLPNSLDTLGWAYYQTVRTLLLLLPFRRTL